MCSETSSPRLSFSYNLPEDGSVPMEAKRQDTTLLDNSNVEFEFSINVENESSCADEVFSNGIILPFTASLPPLPLPPIAIEIINSKKQMMKMTLENSSSSTAAAADHNEYLEQRVSESKSSFWGFKRSSSLNFETRIRPSFCPLPILSRSNSTGSSSSSSSSLPNSNSKNSKHHSHKHHSASTKKSSSSSSSTSASLNQYKAQIMCKNQGGVYGNYGHYIGPVLNVPPKFFGFGSLLRCGMDKKNKK